MQICRIFILFFLKLSDGYAFQIPASGLMEALQIGIGHSIGSIAPKAARDILMKDFSELEIVHFPA